MRGANVYVVVVATCAFRLIDAFCPLPSIPHHGPERRAPQRRRIRGRDRVTAVTLSGETLAIGAVVAGVTTVIAASKTLSTVAGAFKLADYRTTSGHDLRLDEKLKSKRRALTASDPMRKAPSSPSSGSGAVMDWRDEIRVASQLPEDDDGAGVTVL